MEMQEIGRVSLAVSKVGVLEDSIASQAMDILGYNAERALLESNASSTIGSLEKALAELEIDILNAADVERYKLEKKHEAERRELERQIAESGDRAAKARLSMYIHWEERRISDYRQPIPDFVLNKAIQIKKACPSVEFEICFLEEHPDPFLIAKIGYSERYYIEVWGEPKFEGR